MHTVDAATALEALVATSLSPIEPDAASDSALRKRLFQRVARSAKASAPFVNVRKGDGQWREASPGVFSKLLYAAHGVVSRMVRLEPGARWALEQTGGADELLVLSGDLQIEGLQLGPHDYRLRGIDAAAAEAQSSSGALVFWRHSGTPQTAFGTVRESITVHASTTNGWEPLRPGVMLKPLFGVGDRVSMLARLDKGGTVPTHVHECAEECLMLQGDMFLGDILLLEGEYQWAPGGSNHEMLYSDVGCILFIHGAVDPALSEPA
jgi:hypothetical protein